MFDTSKQHCYTLKRFSDIGQILLKERVFNFILEMLLKSLTFLLLYSEVIALGEKKINLNKESFSLGEFTLLRLFQSSKL